MALAYLLDPTNQYQNVAGVNNVAGWFEVFISDTPERADVYVDFAGTRAPERIGIDNDGRAVMVVDGEGVYRVEMHAPNGDLLWTQYPVWPVGQGGGGAIGVDIGSSDGSIDVQRTQVGSVVNYDLSVASDSTDLLGWGEYIGYTMDGTHMVPSYNAGTIETGSHGIRLHGGQYYHVTVTLGASSVEQNVYDAFQVSFKGVDGDGVVSTFTTKSFHYDASTGEGHSYDVSFDMMPATDVEMYAEATGLESGISVGIAEVYVHRVYSGAPAIPGGVADKEWVEENYQEKLTAGNNITIENNVISATAEPQVQADWAQTDPNEVDYIKNKPTIDQTYDSTSANAQSGTAVAEAIANADTGMFIAEYAVTLWSDVKAAYDAGKILCFKYNNNFGELLSFDGSMFRFGIYRVVTPRNESNQSDVMDVYWLTGNASYSSWGAEGTIRIALQESFSNGLQSTTAYGIRTTSVKAGTGITVDRNHGVSVTLPVPDTTSASQGDVLVVGQNGLEWTTLSSDYFLATYGTTTFTEIANAHRQGKLVFLYKTGSEVGVSYYLIPLDILFFTEDPSTSYAKFNGYITPDTYSGIASWHCYKVTGANAWSTEPCTAIISPASGDVGKVYKAYAANRAGWVSVNEVPSSTTSDANKVLTVNSSGNAEWATPTTITVDQTYNASSTNAQSGTAVAGALSTLSIPTATSDLTNDSGFITQSDVHVQDVTINGVSVVNSLGVAEVPRQVNADWDATAGAAEILNKPSIPVIGTITL